MAKKFEISLKLQPLDLLFLMRPPMLIPVWAFFLAGFWRSKNILLPEILLQIRYSFTLKGNFWLSFVSFSLLMGAVYIINQIVDRESDRENRKLFLIPLGIVPVKLAFSVCGILVIVSLIIGYKYGTVYLVFLIVSLCMGILYSVPPFRFKGKPVLDIISNSIGYGMLAFGIGWITASSFSVELLVHSIPYFFAAASIFAVSTILDVEGDKKDGVITTGVCFEKKVTIVISAVTLLISLISALFIRDMVIGITAVIGFPIIIVVIMKKRREFITFYMRGVSYVFIILIAILFPWFLLLLFAVYSISKWYYKYRFGIRYPELLEREDE